MDEVEAASAPDGRSTDQLSVAEPWQDLTEVGRNKWVKKGLTVWFAGPTDAILGAGERTDRLSGTRGAKVTAQKNKNYSDGSAATWPCPPSGGRPLVSRLHPRYQEQWRRVHRKDLRRVEKPRRSTRSGKEGRLSCPLRRRRRSDRHRRRYPNLDSARYGRQHNRRRDFGQKGLS